MQAWSLSTTDFKVFSCYYREAKKDQIVSGTLVLYIIIYYIVAFSINVIIHIYLYIHKNQVQIPYVLLDVLLQSNEIEVSTIYTMQNSMQHQQQQ